MSKLLEIYLHLASGLLGTTYGWGEEMCGETTKPRLCQAGERTASGVNLDPQSPQVALAAPTILRIPPEGIWIWLRLVGSEYCKPIHLVDKMSERWVGERGWDLTFGAIKSLGGIPSNSWSARVELCPRSARKWRKDPVWEVSPSYTRELSI